MTVIGQCIYLINNPHLLLQIPIKFQVQACTQYSRLNIYIRHPHLNSITMAAFVPFLVVLAVSALAERKA
jgi:hypothetical protein